MIKKYIIIASLFNVFLIALFSVWLFVISKDELIDSGVLEVIVLLVLPFLYMVPPVFYTIKTFKQSEKKIKYLYVISLGVMFLSFVLNLVLFLADFYYNYGYWYNYNYPGIYTPSIYVSGYYKEIYSVNYLILILAFLVFPIIATIKTCLKIKKQHLEYLNHVLVKSKKGLTIINPEEKSIAYRDKAILLSEAKDIKLLNNSSIIAKFKMEEIMAGENMFNNISNLLNENTSSVGKKSNKFSVAFKTTNIYNAVFFIPASFENCIKILETISLIMNVDSIMKSNE